MNDSMNLPRRLPVQRVSSTVQEKTRPHRGERPAPRPRPGPGEGTGRVVPHKHHASPRPPGLRPGPKRAPRAGPGRANLEGPSVNKTTASQLVPANAKTCGLGRNFPPGSAGPVPVCTSQEVKCGGARGFWGSRGRGAAGGPPAVRSWQFPMIGKAAGSWLPHQANAASAAWNGTRSFEWPGIEVPPFQGQGFQGGASTRDCRATAHPSRWKGDASAK